MQATTSLSLTRAIPAMASRLHIARGTKRSVRRGLYGPQVSSATRMRHVTASTCYRTVREAFTCVQELSV